MRMGYQLKIPVMDFFKEMQLVYSYAPEADVIDKYSVGELDV